MPVLDELTEETELDWAHIEKKGRQYCQTGITVDSERPLKKRATKNARKRLGQTNVVSRFQEELEKMGMAVQNELDGDKCIWERQGISQLLNQSQYLKNGSRQTQLLQNTKYAV